MKCVNKLSRNRIAIGMKDVEVSRVHLSSGGHVLYMTSDLVISGRCQEKNAKELYLN